MYKELSMSLPWMVRSLFFIFIIMGSCNNHDRSDENAEPEKSVKQLFEVYKVSGPKNALDQLLLTNKYISKANADSVGVQLERLTKDFGDYQGYEIIATKNYGKGIVLITCIVKYSQLPIRFNFRFYQPGNGWRIQDFNYQTNFLKELE
jgi:hypothetical protein